MSNKQRAMIDALRDAGIDAFTSGQGVVALVLDQDSKGVIYDREQRIESFADLRAIIAS